MIFDLSIGGVLIPGLLVFAVLGLAGAVVVTRLLAIAGGRRLFAHWPLVELAIFALLYALLVQIAPSLGLPQ